MNPFQAISDPNRRQMLDLLRTQGPLRAGEIVAHFPQISQPAVSKHLRVLRQARLVSSTKSGREQWYHLDALPLESIAYWLGDYEAVWRERLDRLKQIAEVTAPDKAKANSVSHAPTRTYSTLEQQDQDHQNKNQGEK